MNYNLEYIEKLRIHELRDYARKLGVSSPTTMKKEELLSNILEIVSSKGLQNTNNNEKEGLDFFALLTAENSSILSDLLDGNKKSKSAMLIKKGDNADNGILDTNNMEPFTYSLGQNSAEYGSDDVVSLCGYVDIHTNGYGILRCEGFVPNDSDAFFTSALVKKYNLKKGMFIAGNAKYVIEGKPRVLYEITEIQDKAAHKNSENFENFVINGLGEELYLDKHNLKIKLGERQYISSASLDELVTLGYDIVEENSSYVKLINIKSKPEDNYKSDGKLEIINVPFSKTEIEVINTVDLVLERVKREYELGKSNVVIIYNFCELIRLINSAYEGCYDFTKFNAKTINKIYNILYTARHFQKDNSCTIVCVDKNGVTRDMQSIMELEFLPLFNKINDTVLTK